MIWRSILADGGKTAAFARYVLIQTSLAVLPVCVIVGIGRESLTTSLALGAGLFVLAILLAFPLRLLALVFKLRKRGRTPEEISAMSTEAFVVEMQTPLGAAPRQQ